MRRLRYPFSRGYGVTRSLRRSGEERALPRNKSALPDSVEAAVSAATSTEMQAIRLPLQYKQKRPAGFFQQGALN